MEFSDEFVVSKGEDLTPGPKIASVTQGIVQQRFFFKVTGQRKLQTWTSEGGRKSTYPH